MLLTEGQVDIALTVGTGEKVVVGTLVDGDLMALSALIPPYHLSATGIAKVDGKLIQIKADKLRTLLEDNPGLGYRLMQGAAKGLMTRLQNTRVELAGQSYA
jgi:CRP-like cAMP-binding protein